ncbi:IclR family transcriptional regulator [Pseudoalteromonas pernae]|uniref:IclR family transcriptional regulator n=1 Tax=Pseudoalteromonas pernae TaxID=3118054 RepID=UPI0032424785
MAEKETKYKAPALEKGMAIIELLAKTPEGLSLTQISESMGKSKAEIFRMVAVLNDLHYLEFYQTERVYRLSLKLYRLTHRYAPVHHLNTVAFPIIQTLCSDIQQSCHLVVYSDGGGLILSHQDYDTNSNCLTLPVGGRGPLTDNCAGHVLLAYATYDNRERMLKAYQHHHPDLSLDLMALRNIWLRVKEQGHEAMPSPVLAGVYDIGVPIFDYYHNAVAVLMTSILTYRDESRNPDFDLITTKLKETSMLISTKMGFLEET